jgi:hypothetical protein
VRDRRRKRRIFSLFFLFFEAASAAAVGRTVQTELENESNKPDQV